MTGLLYNSSNNISIPKGTIITCLKGHRVAEVTEDVLDRHVYSKSLDYKFNTPGPPLGAKTSNIKCGDCGSKFVSKYVYDPDGFTMCVLLFHTDKDRWIGPFNIDITEEERILNHIIHSTKPNSWLDY